ncbi:hypothetical protein ACQP2U_16240 [Nocardia sp. CA-084685]|uniref:hypothetical protein n=1 Tax=Nocardia sp. CA-084685 TaxID=3239970 RepID=UPI003D986D2A
MHHDLHSAITGEAIVPTTSLSTTMRAAVCVRAGGPEVLEIRELPVSALREGWSLVQVKGVA